MRVLKSILEQLFDPSNGDLSWVGNINLDLIGRLEAFGLSLILATRLEPIKSLPPEIKRLNNKNRVQGQLRNALVSEINALLIDAELHPMKYVGSAAFASQHRMSIPIKITKVVTSNPAEELLKVLSKWKPVHKNNRIILPSTIAGKCTIFLTNDLRPYPNSFVERLLWLPNPKIISACCYGIHLLRSGKENVPPQFQDKVVEFLEFLLPFKDHAVWQDQLNLLRPPYNHLYRDALAKIHRKNSTTAPINPSWHNRLFKDQLGHMLPQRALDQRNKNTIRERKITQLALIHELGQLQNKFIAAGIDVIHYKGPVWSYQQTGELGSRIFHDLDILAATTDLPLIDQILSGHQYKSKYPEGPISFWKSTVIDRELSYFKQGQNGQHLYHFEVHQSVAPYEYRFGLDFELLSKHTLAIEINGVLFKALSNEMSILVAAVSFAKDGWVSPKQILDIHRFVESEPLDWDLLLDLSAQLGLSQYLYVALETSQRLFQTILPLQIRNRTAQNSAVVLSILENLERDVPTNQTIIRNTREGRTCRSKMKLGRIVAQLAPNHADQQFWKYLPDKRSMLPLYAVLKPIRIFLQGTNNDDDFRPWV